MEEYKEMKLDEIAIAPIIVRTSLVEAWTQQDLPTGEREYGWDPNERIDQGDLARRMGRAPIKRGKPSKPKMAGTSNPSYSSSREKEEFGLYHDDNKYQKQIKIFYGLKLLKNTQNTKQTPPDELAAYRRVLDGLKGRNQRRFSIGGQQELLRQAADTVIKQISHYSRGKRQAVIIPTPSTAPLANQWATTLSQEMKSKGYQTEVRDVLEYNPQYKYSLSPGEKGKISPDALRKNLNIYKDIIVDEFVRGFRSDEDAMETLLAAQDWAENHLKREPDNELVQIDKQAIDYAVDEFERIIDMPAEEFEQMRKDAIAQKGTKPTKLHDLFGGLRRHVWDKTRIKGGSELGEISDNVLVIIADDNVESGSMIIDTYRMLYKQGLVDKNKNEVVGAVIHNLNID